MTAPKVSARLMSAIDRAITERAMMSCREPIFLASGAQSNTAMR